MSDAEATPSKPLPWTEEAKFLLRIISQLRGDGKAINWSRLQMEGRTTKSLQNIWTKINKEITEMENEEGENGPVTPTKVKPTPRKARTKKVDKSEAMAAPGASDEEDSEVKKTLKKRGPPARRGGGRGPAKRVKSEASGDEEDNQEI